MNNIGYRTFFKIIGLFVSSRLILVAILFFATNNFTTLNEKKNYFKYSDNKVLNYCGYWDTGWYMYVANSGYVKAPEGQQSNYGFFPFYPESMKLAGIPFHDNFIGGVIASNIFLFLASIFLYLLCLKIYGDRSIAISSVAILYFFPGSYLFSGVFSEASFICLSLICIYFFEEEKYVLSGVAGFLLSLTRPFGVLVVIPLAIRYFAKNKMTFKAKVLPLLLIPAGTLSFFIFCYLTTGDFFMYIHAKQTGWYTGISEPLSTLVMGVFRPGNCYVLFNSIYTVGIIAFSMLFFKQVPFYLWVWSFLLILTPLANGNVNLICMPRYILVCFPIMMAIAAYAREKRLGWLLIVFLSAINFILAGYYSLGYQFTA